MGKTHFVEMGKPIFPTESSSSLDFVVMMNLNVSDWIQSNLQTIYILVKAIDK